MGEEKAISIISMFLTGVLGGYIIKLVLNILHTLYNDLRKKLK